MTEPPWNDATSLTAYTKLYQGWVKPCKKELKHNLKHSNLSLFFGRLVINIYLQETTSQLDFININNCLNLELLRRHLSGRYILPAMLNNFLTVADDTGMPNADSASEKNSFFLLDTKSLMHLIVQQNFHTCFAEANVLIKNVYNLQ